MKSFIFICALLVFSNSAYAQNFAEITQQEMDHAAKDAKNAIARAKSGLGKVYCTPGNSGGMRLYLDQSSRLMFSFPSVMGIEKGMEMPGVIIKSANTPIKSEVTQTLRIHGISGKIADQTLALMMHTYEKGRTLQTVIVMGYYLDNNNDIIPEDSFVVLADNFNGTYFVGSTRNCK